jgi:hypothetical protein
MGISSSFVLNVIKLPDYDEATGTPVVMASTEGGVNIENIAAKTP